MPTRNGAREEMSVTFMQTAFGMHETLSLNLQDRCGCLANTIITPSFLINGDNLVFVWPPESAT